MTRRSGGVEANGSAPCPGRRYPQPADDTDDVVAVREALADLSEADRELLQLAAVEGLTRARSRACPGAGRSQRGCGCTAPEPDAVPRVGHYRGRRGAADRGAGGGRRGRATAPPDRPRGVVAPVDDEQGDGAGAIDDPRALLDTAVERTRGALGAAGQRWSMEMWRITRPTGVDHLSREQLGAPHLARYRTLDRDGDWSAPPATDSGAAPLAMRYVDGPLAEAPGILPFGVDRGGVRPRALRRARHHGSRRRRASPRGPRRRRTRRRAGS